MLVCRWKEIIEGGWGVLERTLHAPLAVLRWGEPLPEPEGEGRFWERYDILLNRIPGVLVEVRGVWFFVTAGHCINKMIQASDRGRRRMRTSLLLAGRDSSQLNEIENPIHESDVLEQSEALGLDIAVLPLHVDPNVILDLGGNAIPERMVLSTNKDVDGYIAIGTPDSHGESRVANETEHTVEFSDRMLIAILCCNPVAEPPPDLKGSRVILAQRVPITGILPDGSIEHVTNAIGMSGSPLFALMDHKHSVDIRLAGVVTHTGLDDTTLLVGAKLHPLVVRLAISALLVRCGKADWA